ncbi:FAD-dependent monooxygenase [Gulosibacter molinativorax]|uniref:3-hydroxybenzoate 4-monooxygenase n=1 Tax=Gulosibacter molinativorax TaxID=256821 RepID=A0ABT7C4N5_9MICO|nr:FAD-dependent monooxygenase [Gulosibacter molinativorax]MDJ1370166.1 3-hydroxybenzoate 4-monooxygenase [Gulosibacter molinativorax]QUY61577.1 M-hydroxybenzoate 4-hydroxylase [Gulosibacter molinativorax]
MQFHHHGYVSQEPRVHEAAGYGLNRPSDLPDELDVLIVGSGPAGVIAAAQLSQYPDIRTHVIERRDSRLKLGQADGVQARTVETFKCFGFEERIVAEAYRITETAFWNPDPENPANIIRTGRTADDARGISEFQHIVVNQARVLDYFIEFAERAPGRITPNYGYEFVGLEINDEDEYPVTVTVAHTTGERAGEERTIRAKYVIGSDGAASKVRKSIGRRLVGDVSNHAWGVMDVLSQSTFPDIRIKSVIHSTAGSILHIPREGGHLTRIYVDLGVVPEDDNHAIRQTPLDEIIQKANNILHPYNLDVKDVPWHSVYEVGHRVTDKFDNVDESEVGTRTPRVFITGDACHTHSAKAGQGMNVSMQDGWNISWKLGQVLSGLAPESLLDTYSAERQSVAVDLINFDKQWSTLMAKKPEEFESPGEVEEFYVKTAEFPAGFMTEYTPTILTGEATHQDLAKGFPIGKRFKAAPVIRVADVNPIYLGHQAYADGRYRIYVFADPAKAGEDSPTERLAEWLQTSPESPINKFTPIGDDRNSRFEVNVVYQQRYTEFDFSDIHKAFRPDHGPFQLQDYFRVHSIGTITDVNDMAAAQHEQDIYDLREISRDGAIVIVRPDQYVANILPLEAREELTEFFAQSMLEQR